MFATRVFGYRMLEFWELLYYAIRNKIAQTILKLLANVEPYEQILL